MIIEREEYGKQHKHFLNRPFVHLIKLSVYFSRDTFIGVGPPSRF